MTTRVRTCAPWVLALLLCTGSSCGARAGSVTSVGPGEGDGPNPCHACLDGCSVAVNKCVVGWAFDVRSCELKCDKTFSGEAITDCLERRCAPMAVELEEECLLLEEECPEACLEDHDENVCNADRILPPGVTEETIAACCACEKACNETMNQCGDLTLQVEDGCLSDCEKLGTRDEEEISTCHDECSWSGDELRRKCYLTADACLVDCAESCGASTCIGPWHEPALP